MKRETQETQFEGDSPATILLFRTKFQEHWRVVAYAIDVD
jgi:hypothetical protein